MLARVPEAGVELLQFAHSHYNEKARWALDWKRIPHRRTTLLPGPHQARVRRLTGRTQVPVLVVDGAVVAGSARILEELERRWPEPPLYPRDPAQRARALEIERWFDAEVGPKVRQALFSVLLEEGGYLCSLFSEDHALPARLLYRAGFPVARRLISRAYRLSDAAVVQAAFAGAFEGLDFVAKQAGPSGYLVGDSFSVADLAAAALLAPACNPPGCAMTLPEPQPARLRGFLARFAAHPGTAWVLRSYREERPPAACVPGA
jgi:glutathione S-transferase